MLKQDQTQHTINSEEKKRLTCSDGSSFYAFFTACGTSSGEQLPLHHQPRCSRVAWAHPRAYRMVPWKPETETNRRGPRTHPDGAPGAPVKRYLSHISWSFAVAFYCSSTTQVTQSNRSSAPPMCTRTQINGNRVNITQQTSQTGHLFNNGRAPF